MPSKHGSVVLDPAAIERERVFLALESRADRPVRFVCAPAGSGKTTALLQYAAAYPRTEYVAARPGMTIAELERIVASVPTNSQLIIDDLDLALPAAIDELLKAVVSCAPHAPRLIVSSRSCRLLRAQNIVARGFGSVIDRTDLAFDLAETQQLADRLGLTYDAKDLAELLHVTEGWTLPLTWILRSATEDTRRMRDAFERWSSRYGPLLIEFVAEHCSRDTGMRDAFLAALRDRAQCTQPVLAELAAAGCPVADVRGSLRPYRILRRLATRSLVKSRRAEPETSQPLALNLLGRFACRVGDRHVVFARRRDQNVLVCVALSPDARVTRQELIAAFWPDVPQAVAMQGLRTSLSRLRRSIADAAGCEAERFLQIDATISINLENATVDARRFSEHVEYGAMEERRGELESARRHYAAAERLYTDHLLASEAVEPVLAPHVREYMARFGMVLDRLVELFTQMRDLDAARTYERRGLPLRKITAALQTA